VKRFVLVLLTALTLAVSTPACSFFRSLDAKAEQAANAYNGVVDALEALDQASVDYLESKDAITLDDIQRAKDHAAKLKEAREDLLEAKRLFEAKSYKAAAVKLALALISLETVASELEALGVKLDSTVRYGLDAGHELLGSSKPGT
jgi:hypothetical protein